ncbi:NAD(P)H-hydrate epimerase-like [Sycon ciliatum]|uniref:NAD(P)H-hydrate epimerase-like n=1 Tax=Sycon ciliatum TaxID=27933 RepID=UPI0020AAE126|eukprot:scpid85088/ scgid6203/ NAD(P)H-hydrate epimerase; NAD(P)HX epimerase
MWLLVSLGSLGRRARQSQQFLLRPRRTMARTSPAQASHPGYLNQVDAQQLDQDLFNECGYGLDQLMELAGLSVAIGLAKVYPVRCNVLVCCGPGNNGGDGLVAARHLKAFGYSPTVLYPKRPERLPFTNLSKSCVVMNIPLLGTDVIPSPTDIRDQYQVVLDGIFGFSFKGNVRAPFDKLLDSLMACDVPVCSIDIPSGWDVELGNPNGLQPETLISLTAPKKCAAFFSGKHHLLGGRFIPDFIAERYNLRIPAYPAEDQVVVLSSTNACSAS